MPYTLKEVTEEIMQPFFEQHEQGSFAQSIEMANVRRDNGRTVHYLAIYEGDKIVGGFQLSLIAGRIASADITAGPLLDFTNEKLVEFFTSSVKEYLLGKSCAYLTINPNVSYSDQLVDDMKQLGWSYSGRVNASSVGVRGGIRWMYVKHLDELTLDNYQESYIKRHRRYIRNHDPKLTIRQLGRDEISIFTNIMRHTAERRQFHSRSDAYFTSLFDRFGDKALFKVAELEQEDGSKLPIGAIIFIDSNKEVVSYLGGALSEYAKYRASYLLHDDMIRYSVEKGYPIYNFYGIEGDITNPQSEGYGIYEFKAKFGTGEAIELVGEFVLPIRKLAFAASKLLRKIS